MSTNRKLHDGFFDSLSPNPPEQANSERPIKLALSIFFAVELGSKPQVALLPILPMLSSR